MCKISIALATYNGEHFLKELLDSVLAQTVSDFELVICDDSSTDSTFQIIAGYEKKDARIKIFQNEINLGFKKNFERILSLCKGEYIAFCDQDDIWTPDHLETLLTNIGDSDCIGANSLIIDENGTSQSKTFLEYLFIHQPPKNSDELFQHELYSNIIQGAASLIKSSLIKKALPIPEDVQYHDYWFALNAGLNNGCKYIPKVILNYRRHTGNASAYQEISLFKFFRELRQFSNDKENFYHERILLLENLKGKNATMQQKKWIDEAYSFFSSLSEGTEKIKCVLHFVKNYNVITFSKKRILPLFLYRLFAIIFFGVKG